MSKRNVGERGKILFDEIDLGILFWLDKHERGLKVLELANILKIKHNNLKPHIDKLLFLRLIATIVSKKSDKGLF